MKGLGALHHVVLPPDGGPLLVRVEFLVLIFVVVQILVPR